MSDIDTCDHEGLLISGDPPTLYCESCETLWIHESKIARLTKANAKLREALEAIIDLAKTRWMPVRIFRSEKQAGIDDAKYEGADECADIARKALGVSD